MLVTSHNPNPLRMSVSQSAPMAKPHTITKEDFLAQFFDAQGNLKPEFRKISYENGGEYIGQYQDCRQGKGVFSFPNRDVYMGFWKDDKFNGDGLYVYATG